ncbi:hypothetical protein LOTGIDRAFT_155729 [Lottia gigantea]|uniref:Uncharacterized protein n=1 Tax=Lottia gigantea TaxID=225164 RepID=V3ZF24_LOTGI|nr:hypothetical protein LOTGIDRAFT_155729 [Lottia gigantea]ESO82712.1 hypothetical protein LOTGIDRAFT_155729 [Lottia gigantea]
MCIVQDSRRRGWLEYKYDKLRIHIKVATEKWNNLTVDVNEAMLSQNIEEIKVAMMSEFELTPLRDDEQEASNYGSKVNNIGGEQPNRDGHRKRNELRMFSTRIIMKRRHQFCRALLIFLVLSLVAIICLLLAFYLNETKKRKHENTNLLTTHVNVRPILPKGAIYVRSFKSYLNTMDNRIFEALFSNDTSLKLYGNKGLNSDKFKIDSLSVTHSNQGEIRIRFGRQNNLAYVMLGNRAQVDYEWSRDLTSFDIKVYLSTTLKGFDATSFLFTVRLMEHATLFQIIFKTLCGKRPEVVFPSNLKKRRCASYFPLRVTKCGSKNVYNGVFLEGKINLGNSHVLLPAQEWPLDSAECFKQPEDENSKYNFYIPLPTSVTDDSSCNMATKYFITVCAVIPVKLSAEKICINISQQINSSGERKFDELVNLVYDSCLNILSSLLLMCSSLQTEYKPLSKSHSPFFLLSDRTVRNKLCSNSKVSDSLIPDSVKVSVVAFCPTEHPKISPEQLVYVNQSVSAGNNIHINCRGPPEITLYQLAHSYTGSGEHLTTLNHNFRMCSKCAYEAVVTVRVLDNEVCCENICSRDNTSVCALGRLELEETYQFITHSNLYCHNFLDNMASDTASLNIHCAGKCVNHFTVDFKVTNFREQEIFYHQPLFCTGTSSQTCNSKFGS